MKKNRLCVIFFMLIICSNMAHALDVGYLEIEVNKEAATIKTSLEYNPASVRSPSQLFHSTLGKSFWKSGNSRCSWRHISNKVISPEQVLVSADAECAEINSELNLDLAFLLHSIPGYRVLGRIKNDGEESTFLASLTNRFVKINPIHEKSFSHYVISGAKQIGATPGEWFSTKGDRLPLGLPHILFLVTLVVTAGNFLVVFKTLIGFSLGNTLALLLVAFGGISIPPGLVEPAIAASIVFIAAESFFNKRLAHRFGISSLFGMIHGFGLAGGLKILNLTLVNMLKAIVGFNLGIEIGQILIILIIIPVFIFMKKYSNYHQHFIRGTTACLMIVGFYWIIDMTVI